MLLFIFGAVVSFYHVGIEQGFFNESLVCDLGASSENLSSEELLKKLETNYDIDEKKIVSDKLLATKLRKLNQDEVYGGRSLRSILERFDNKMSSPRDELSKKDVKIIKNFLKIELIK